MAHTTYLVPISKSQPAQIPWKCLVLEIMLKLNYFHISLSDIFRNTHIRLISSSWVNWHITQLGKKNFAATAQWKTAPTLKLCHTTQLVLNNIKQSWLFSWKCVFLELNLKVTTGQTFFALMPFFLTRWDESNDVSDMSGKTDFTSDSPLKNDPYPKIAKIKNCFKIGKKCQRVMKTCWNCSKIFFRFPMLYT